MANNKVFKLLQSCDNSCTFICNHIASLRYTLTQSCYVASLRTCKGEICSDLVSFYAYFTLFRITCTTFTHCLRFIVIGRQVSQTIVDGGTRKKDIAFKTSRGEYQYRYRLHGKIVTFPKKRFVIDVHYRILNL